MRIYHQVGGHKDQFGMGFMNHNLRYLQSLAGIGRVPAGELITPDGEHLSQYVLAKTVSHLRSAVARPPPWVC